ncbi:alpha/beta hydrolase [Rhodococcus erythropolis]|uniref:Alpha/beta-hydrolase family protein n=1 Tax=Rhodococcus erythropolis TaxID=1833 RepID=A0AAX3ZZV7_RHOER|nr:alpha/beta-hydrolase family protein [Rhodococcus erythropolis]WMN01885.1 alpha/beta-hydrolase family protein [Rhodococcus erythropolis]WMN03171.1 alpha/beta-hydrolase family protein [Rhodococcus erythropolis]
MRYLAFPKSFRPIVNAGHRRLIRDTFASYLQRSVSDDVDVDLDEINRAFEAEQNGPVDFYQEPWKSMWKPVKPPKKVDATDDDVDEIEDSDDELLVPTTEFSIVDPDQELADSVVWLILLEAGRGLRHLTRGLAAVALRFVPKETAKVASLVVVFALAIFVVNGALYNGLIAFANWSFSGADNDTPGGIDQPLIAERSGSPMSAEAWDSLGKEGRTFMGNGPSAEQIAAVTGRDAKQPIRVYAGRESSDSVDGVAGRVVAELERTGGFDRAVLAVVTTTGRGWVNNDVASAFEYVQGGDTAIAAMQYSFLPSPLAFIADRETPMAAGRALFNAVYAKWIDLPLDKRPKLVVFGESLGSYGGQAAFAGAQDMATRVDGALWSGTPNFTAQWQEITGSRDSGSPEAVPVIDDGQSIRFAAYPEDLEIDAPWNDTRVVYWQHASDPIVWWSFDLLLNKPDWLAEPLGRDVDPGMTWIPLVTFWQVTLDMVFSADVPPGHGHNYGAEAADMWARILHPENWSQSDTDAIRAALTNNFQPAE